MIDYSHNKKYSPNGVTTPTVSRCVCGHVLEWHFKVIKSENAYVMSPAYRHPNADTCPSNTCDCTQPAWDGNPPAKLPDILATPRSQSVPAA